MLEEIGKPLDAVILLQVSDEVANERGSAAARDAGRTRGRLARGDPRTGSGSTTSSRSWWSSATSDSRAPRSCTSTASRASDDVLRSDPDALAGSGGEPMIIRKSAARDREDRRGGRARRRDDRARRHAASSGQSRRTSSTQRRGRLHPRARRHPDLRGLQGLPEGDLHLAERRRRPRNPGRLRRRRGRSSSRSTSASTLDGYIADSAYTFGVGADRARGRRLLDVAQDALAAGIAEARRRQPGRRRLARDPGGRRGGGVLRHPQPRRPRRRPLTTTRICTSRTTASPAAGPRLSEGMTIAIEPMITAGDRDGRDDGRRLDDPDGRRLHCRRTSQAHRRDHRRRARQSSRLAVGVPGRASGFSGKVSATMSRRGRKSRVRYVARCSGTKLPPTGGLFAREVAVKEEKIGGRRRGRRGALQHDVPGAARQRSCSVLARISGKMREALHPHTPATASRSSSLRTTSPAAESPSDDSRIKMKVRPSSQADV